MRNAPYCHLWSPQLYHISFHFISQTARFSKQKGHHHHHHHVPEGLGVFPVP
jgi:hypothetical protein